MPITQLVANAVHISEFAYDAKAKMMLNGTCTQASAAMCLAASLGTPTSGAATTALMIDMRDRMFALGECAANGAATIANMAKELRRRGARVLLEWDFGQVGDWHAQLLAHAGVHPIVLQIANAQGMVDAAGVHEDAGVHYHAIAVLGKATEGYVVSDPNNPTVGQTFDIYPLATLLTAQPSGMIILDAPPHAVPPPAAPPTPSATAAGHPKTPAANVPSGWHDDGQTLTPPAAPDGTVYPVSEPFRAQILDLVARCLMGANDMPLGGAKRISATRQELTTMYHRLVQEQGGAPFLANLGASVLAYEEKYGRL